MTLKQKVFIPIFIAILVLGSLGYFLVHIEFSELKSHFYYDIVRNKKNEIPAFIEFATQQILEKAALFAQLPIVIETFELAHTGNIEDEADTKAQKARQQLRQALKDHMESYSTILGGDKLKLHFHLPNGRSLVRMWRDKQSKRNNQWIDISDDISSFRQTVLDVNQSGQPVKGIELGRGGFVLRGLAPIRSQQGKQLGSVEVLLDFNPILDSLIHNLGELERQGLFLFMKADQLSITTRLQDSEKHPILGNKYVYVYGTQDQYGREQIDIDFLDHIQDSLYLTEKKGFILSGFPVQDYRTQNIGIIVYAFDISHEVGLIHTLTFTLMSILAIILLLLGLIIYIVISQYVVKPLNKIVDFAQKVKAGHSQASLEIPSTDEMGQMSIALNQMVESQCQVIEQIQHFGLQVTFSATELTTAAEQQKNTMLNQVNSTQHVQKSVEDISKVATMLVETMRQVAMLSSETAEIANSGQTNLLHLQDSTQSMENASQAISNRLKAINEKTENITSVVATINKVADQTNLLSLNAAIEAEKAGEYGRGFNVVAREIRRLADQTAVATLDIEQMVKEMQTAVSAGVMEMDKFIAAVQNSTAGVDQTSVHLKKIIEQVQALSPRFEEVNRAMTHQSDNVQQINHAMTEVSEGMQQMAKSLEESFKIIEQLNEAAKAL